METIPEKLLRTCYDRDCRDLLIAGTQLRCTRLAAETIYQLEATAEAGGVTLRLSDYGRMPPEALTRREPRDADWPAVLDELLAAGEEYSGLRRDLAGARRRKNAAGCLKNR